MTSSSPDCCWLGLDPDPVCDLPSSRDCESDGRRRTGGPGSWFGSPLVRESVGRRRTGGGPELLSFRPGSLTPLEGSDDLSRCVPPEFDGGREYPELSPLVFESLGCFRGSDG